MCTEGEGGGEEGGEQGDKRKTYIWTGAQGGRGGSARVRRCSPSQIYTSH